MKIISLIFTVFITLQVQAQSNTFPQNLVFEGAGIRGIAYCGAIKALEQKGLLQQVQRVGGTSAGAITALMLSLGYSSEEIAWTIQHTSFKKLNDGRYFFPGGMNRFYRYYGWYRGRAFEKWLARIIEAKTSNANITFGQLRQQGYKDLYVTGTSLTRQQLVVFSYESYPDMKVKDAVRVSVSIPLYFEPVFINSAGNIFTHPKNTGGLDILVDGGFLANFPIRLFDSTRYTGAAEANGFKINPQTLGFRIDRDEQIESDAGSRGLAVRQITNLKEYMVAFYTIVLESLNRQSLTPADWQRTVSISDGSISPRIRKLPAKEVERLIQNGFSATNQYLKPETGQ